MTERILAADRPDTIHVIPGREVVPVTLLTGFLGAGKTTLLNRILRGDHGLRVGVLVNDFGAINIDAELVEGVEEDTLSLANGCVCCEIRDDLVASLVDLLERNPSIDHVIIEASGIADPEGIAATLVDERSHRLIRLDTITCVVDADTFLDEDTPPGVTELKLRQIGYSDLVVLNKVDLVGYAYAAAVRQAISRLAPGLSIVDAIDGDVPLDILLSVGRFDPTTPPPVTPGRGARSEAAAFDTYHYRSATPLSLTRIEEILRDLPAEVYRVKGMVLSADDPTRRVIVQAVGRRSTITFDEHWGNEPARSDIVVIGTSGALDRTALSDAFDACREAE